MVFLIEVFRMREILEEIFLGVIRQVECSFRNFVGSAIHLRHNCRGDLHQNILKELGAEMHNIAQMGIIG